MLALIGQMLSYNGSVHDCILLRCLASVDEMVGRISMYSAHMLLVSWFAYMGASMQYEACEATLY